MCCRKFVLYFHKRIIAKKRNIHTSLKSGKAMARPKKSDKPKKTAQVEDAGQALGAKDQERNVMDGNVEDVVNTEAGGSGLGRKSKSRSDTESGTDSSMENARRRLQGRKRARIVSPAEMMTRKKTVRERFCFLKYRKEKGKEKESLLW